jgi:uncharacterized protein (DUF3820 family)
MAKRPVEALKDTDEMPFGKHRGKQMRHVEIQYLEWCIRKGFLQDRYPAVFLWCVNNRNKFHRATQMKIPVAAKLKSTPRKEENIFFKVLKSRESGPDDVEVDILDEATVNQLIARAAETGKPITVKHKGTHVATVMKEKPKTIHVGGEMGRKLDGIRRKVDAERKKGEMAKAIRMTRVAPLEWRFEVEDYVRGCGHIITHNGVGIFSESCPDYEDCGHDTGNLYVPGTDKSRDKGIVRFPNIKTEINVHTAVLKANNHFVAEGK